MAEESEKRFHSIMDKLFQSPLNVSSSLSGGNLKVGQKRPNSESALALVDPKVRGNLFEGTRHSKNPAEPPLCRPWDRGDLMRRLATFKSMTWFAKPKVVSAVNCARRGWINIDVDTIACEACGARLLFSTPAAWTQQQVEKAALVFSLKLESAHKPVCPWIDNACDERLAEFPPTPHPVLVEKFNDRFSALSQLQALPIISSSAIENMRSPRIEEFIGQFSTLERGNKSVSLLHIEPAGNGAKASSHDLYYQAQKLISLCGWEPRLLPYIVECKEKSKHLAKVDVSSTSHLVSHISSGSSPSIAPDLDAIEGISIVSKEDIDPNSAVLDCKLCGASVGLWAFLLVPRPLEFLRVVGLTEVNSKQKSTQELCNENLVENTQEVTISLSGGKSTFANSLPNLNKTIAGGPLPTKQDFKATITIPVIGQNLRARFSHDSEFRDRTLHGREGTESAPRNTGIFLEQKNQPECDSIQHVSQPEAGILSKSITVGSDQASSLQHGNSEKGFDHHDQGDPSCIPVETSESIGGASSNACDVVFSFPDTTADGNGTDTDPLLMISFDNLDQHFLEVEESLGKHDSSNMDQREGGTFTGNQTLSTQKGNESIKEKVQNSEMMTNGTGKDDKHLPVDNLMEFDPIRQHRHYCPWILSTAGGPPGWQQTHTALLRQNQHSPPSNPPSTPSTVMVNDPIGSVRKLFMSPSAKRAKLTPGSSERAGCS